MPKTSRALYTRGLRFDSTKKYIEGKANNIYRSVPVSLKSEENKKFKDIAESTFQQWAKKERYGEYDNNTNTKKLRDSTFSNMEGGILDFIRGRESLYVKDNLGLNWAYIKEKALEFN